MVTRSLLYILPLPLFLALVEAKLPWFSALVFGVALMYYFQLENTNRKYFIPTCISLFLIPFAGLAVNYYITDKLLVLVTFTPTIVATAFLALRARTSNTNLFVKLLGPTGVLISGVLLTLTFGEPWSHLGLIFLTIIYFLKKLLTTNELFFRNWILAILSFSVLFLVMYSIVLHEELQDNMQFMEENFQLRKEIQDSKIMNAELEAELELCEQENEKTGS